MTTDATPAPPGRAVSRTDLERHLHGVSFAASDVPDLLGVEVEVLPVDRETRSVLPVEPDGSGRPATHPFFRRLGGRLGWRSSISPTGTPSFLLPDGGRLSFEPGGKIEYSSPPRRYVEVVCEALEGVVGELVDAGRVAGIDFVARGMDPRGRPQDARLHVRSERYRRMRDHYDRRGPWGRRMMLQSAAIHVNVDLGPAPLRRWRVAARAAPWLVATFANSSRAEGRETGHRSWRAAQWRRLDPTRTGLPDPEGDPIGAYARFALGADAFLLGPEDAEAEPFREWLERGVDRDEMVAHLSTLFPEVRPRGYLEVRVFDALPLRWCAAPMVVTAGLLYDPDVLTEALERLAPVQPHDLGRAGEVGVRDEEVRRRALEVLDLSLAGAERLPKGMVGASALAVAREFRDRFTVRGRDPGDDPDDAWL